jgi:hypothetical protein
MIVRMRFRGGGDGAKAVVRVREVMEEGVWVRDHFANEEGHMSAEQWAKEAEKVLFHPARGWAKDTGLLLPEPRKGMLAVVTPQWAMLVPRIVPVDPEDERLRTARVTDVRRVSPPEWSPEDEIDLQFLVTGRREMMRHEDWDVSAAVDRAWMPTRPRLRRR